jgi:hypothetical protein
LKVQGCKLKVFEVEGGYFKTGGSSGRFCKVSPKNKEFPGIAELVTAALRPAAVVPAPP